MFLAAALMAGCGGSGSGAPTANLVCQGAGVVVGGQVTFVKRLYNRQGLTGTRVRKPVRFGLVEVVREFDGAVVASTYTDEFGNYCVTVRGVTPNSPAVYPRIVTKTDPSRVKISVINDITLDPSLWSLYSYAGTPFNGAVPGTARRDMAIPVFVQAGGISFSLSGAFNIMDVVTRGSETALAVAGRVPSTELLVGWTPGTAFGSGTVGTYFVGDDATKQLAGIELSGGDGGGDPDAGDHDEFDDDVILHEYGHFMSYSFSKPAEAGGTHYLNDNTQDIRLAWSEGWATFFSAAARKQQGIPDSHVMVNTRGGDPSHPEHQFSYFFEIETPHSDLLSAINTPLEAHGVYTTSEVAVASVLWDLFDASNESGDGFSLGLSGVWDVFTRLIAAPDNVSFDTFASVLSRNFQNPTLAPTAALRQMQYSRDAYEASGDDQIGSGVPELIPWIPTCHTLFPRGDVDHMRISLSRPSRVTVETFNLSNGADTVLQLLDANGVVVAQNDNAQNPRQFELTSCGNRRVAIPQVYYDGGVNNGGRLASTVSVDLPAGTYFAAVMSRETFNAVAGASGLNFSAGNLGSYDLIVTLQ